MLSQEAVVRTKFNAITAHKGLAQSLVPAKCLTHGLFKLSNYHFVKPPAREGTDAHSKIKNKQMP